MMHRKIQNTIRVYWIAGPNKKWSANSYAYIAKNFPALWFIEVNSSYYGFFSNNNILDSITNTGYYDKHIQGAGQLGKEFKNYYDGEVKMGDTPSLLYMGGKTVSKWRKTVLLDWAKRW